MVLCKYNDFFFFFLTKLINIVRTPLFIISIHFNYFHRIVYDIDCCRITNDFKIHDDSISSLAMSNCDILITGSLDCTVRIWKVPHMSMSQIEFITFLKAELQHKNKVTTMALSL